MIEIKTKSNMDISCYLQGDPAQLFVEYNSATVGMIKRLRDHGDSDKDIRELLLGNVDIAFRILESEGAIKEVSHGKDKSQTVNRNTGL